MTNYSNENILDQFKAKKFDVLVHGTNCVNIFATGLAKAIKEDYPEVWDDELLTEEWPLHKLGKSRLNALGDQWISTSYIIDLHGYKEQLINYVALEKSLIDLKEQLKAIELKEGTKLKIGIPQIGSQFLEGDPLFIREIITRILSEHFDVTIYGKASDEVKDKTLVVGLITVRNSSLIEGAKAIMRYKVFNLWLKIISGNSVILMEEEFYKSSPYQNAKIKHLFLHRPIGELMEDKGVHYDSNRDRLILQARDYCNENDLKYVVLLGGSDMLADLMGYFDAVVVNEIDYHSMDPAFFQFIEHEEDMPDIPPKTFKEGRSTFGMLREDALEPGLITRKLYHRSGKPRADLSDFD